MNTILLLLMLAGLIFWLVQLVDVFKSRKLNRMNKGLWILLFLLGSVLSAVIYWFSKKRRL